MVHQVARAASGTLLFTTSEEGVALWGFIVSQVPGLVALCVMPDHVHLVVRSDAREALGRAMRAYARWRNCRRGQAGPVWQRQPGARLLVDGQKVRRAVRYVHLNPCRARIVRDPLEWPLSTHRDALGLVLAPARPRHGDPGAFHRYVSADPTVDVGGSPLPVPGQPPPAGPGGLLTIRDAVSAVARCPVSEFGRRGPARTLLTRCLRLWSTEPVARIAEQLGMHPSSVRRVAATPDSATRVVAKVLGDHRFAALTAGDLRDAPGWGRYHDRR